jgi:hypothetical protein
MLPGPWSFVFLLSILKSTPLITLTLSLFWEAMTVMITCIRKDDTMLSSAPLRLVTRTRKVTPCWLLVTSPSRLPRYIHCPSSSSRKALGQEPWTPHHDERSVLCSQRPAKSFATRSTRSGWRLCVTIREKAVMYLGRVVAITQLYN